MKFVRVGALGAERPASVNSEMTLHDLPKLVRTGCEAEMSRPDAKARKGGRALRLSEEAFVGGARMWFGFRKVEIVKGVAKAVRLSVNHEEENQ